MNAIEIKNVTKTYKIYNKKLYRVVDSLFNTKHYDEYKALKNVSLTIEKGEAVGILGKNGAGKSTLLKMLTGVTKPTSGNIEVDGKISAILELNSGFDEELSGYENIYIKGLILGFSRAEIDAKIDEIVEFADIGKHMNQPVRTYSSGMKSRLGFAIAVNVDPDILIVDEALSVGDDIFKTKCLSKMTEFRKAGKTIVFVSHSLFTIKSFCTKCAWIKNGELMDYGEMGNVVAKYESYLKEEKAKDKEKIKAKSNGQALERKDYIKISKFKFKNNQSVIKYGQDLEYSFKYNVKMPMENLKWSFTIWDAEKREIYSTDKMGSNYAVESELGEHEIDICIKNLKLLPGKYLLSGEIRDGAGILYVGYSNKRPFEVEVDDTYRGSGIIYLEHDMINNK